MSKKIKVVVDDDYESIRIGILGIFSMSDNIQVVGETGFPDDVIDIVKKEKPDIIVLDISFPNSSKNGLDIAHEHFLLHHQTKRARRLLKDKNSKIPKSI